MKYVRSPLDYASAGNYAAPGKSWNGAPSRLASPDALLKAGALPDTPIPADVENARESFVFDAMAVHAHAALAGWQTTVIGGGVSGNNVLNLILPYDLQVTPSAPFGTRQQALLLAGRDGVFSGITQISLDGGMWSASQATSLSPKFHCLATSGSTIWGAAEGGTGTGDLIYSADAGATWTAATGVGNTGTIQAVHKTPGGAFLAAQDGHVFRATSLAGTWANTLVHNHDLAINFVNNGSTIVMLATFNGAPDIAAWYSLDDGVTWTLAQHFGTAAQSITYSRAMKLFIVVNGAGELWISADGITWAKNKTAAGLVPQIPCGANMLAAIGPAVCTPLEFGPISGCYMRGIAYTCDLGATWFFSYFGLTTGSTNNILGITSVNGRLAAFDRLNVFMSGQLETRDGQLYSGV